MTSLRGRVAVCLTALSFVALSASCSLGLDESLIDKAKDGGLGSGDGAPLDGEPAGDGGADTGISVGPNASACTNDDACTTNQGCLEGKCDLTRKRCVYDVCRPSACNSAACDDQTRECGAPTPYKYKAVQFPVGAQVACVRCAAAVYPWLFVATTAGLLAFNVSNPANPTPPQVPVIGLGFFPSSLVQSGSRVWMLGGVGGSGPTRLQLAYVDSPADPFTTKIEARTILATYNRPAEVTSLFARGGDSALLVGHVEQLPAVAIEAPLDEPASLTATATFAPTNFVPSAVSGKRLLTSTVVNQVASFALIERAGAANPMTGPVVNFTDAGAVSTQRMFAQSADGAIFWVTGVHQGSPAPTSTRAARGYFLVPGEAGPLDDKLGVDVEVYVGDTVLPNAAIFGSNQATLALLDANTVMIATQARENDQQTAVQFVRRDPLGLVQEGNTPAPRRQVLPVPIGAFMAATASNGVGYLIANDQVGPPPGATVYVFDPGCAP
jgi:hypothetical protein